MKFIKSDFLWGGATAAAQIEGAYDVESKSLTIAEMSPFNPNLDRKKLGILTKISRSDFEKAIENKENLHYPKRYGIDHYHRFKEDIELFKNMNMKIYRLSIAWSRIFPNGEENEPNQKGLEFYKNIFEECKKAGMEIMVTLSHYDLPYCISKKYKGWTNRTLIDLFLKYANVVMNEFKDYVKYWLPFNEINIANISPLTGLGIFRSDFATDEEFVSASYQGLHNQFIAQAKTIELGKTISKDFKFGCMVANVATYYKDCDPENVIENMKFQQMKRDFYYDVMINGEYPGYAKRYFKENNIKFDASNEDMQIIKNNPIQFITFSYYMSSVVSKQSNANTMGNLISMEKNPYLQETQWGWQIDPRGLRFTLNDLWNKYHLPLFISENGIGVVEKINENNTVEDDYRIDYLKQHIEQINEAILDGVDVFGYTIWTPIDVVSFSSNEMSKRYGLIYVDYDDYHKGTGNRYLKKSYNWFKNFIETNEL